MGGSAARKTKGKKAEEMDQARLKILIVDDSPAVSDILSQLCEFLGHNVVCAKDGSEGLSLIHAEPDLDLVFTDFKMPVLDGAEMTRRLKTRYPDLPVVLITGSVILTEAELEGPGFDTVIHKPFELQTIAKAIDRLFPRLQPGKSTS